MGGVVCGVDEVGRGCLAGPVFAAAVVVPPGAARQLAGVRDSKALTRSAREAMREAILSCCIVGIGQASVEEVTRLNVLRATFLAMARAVAALPTRPDAVLVDGNRVPDGLGIPARAVIGADARCLSVAAASIIAKVERDELMESLDRDFPGYGWAANAGYGTPSHLGALAVLGPTVHHRMTFAGVLPPAQGMLDL